MTEPTTILGAIASVLVALGVVIGGIKTLSAAKASRDNQPLVMYRNLTQDLQDQRKIEMDERNTLANERRQDTLEREELAKQLRDERIQREKDLKYEREARARDIETERVRLAEEMAAQRVELATALARQRRNDMEEREREFISLRKQIADQETKLLRQDNELKARDAAMAELTKRLDILAEKSRRDAEVIKRLLARNTYLMGIIAEHAPGVKVEPLTEDAILNGKPFPKSNGS